ncbi:MAG: hypothetical protein SH868_06805 [Bythopirellula sp.]|nr:hypothetical protein [Bythopirellula sp.]
MKPGKEREFEQALRVFARESLHLPGTTGIHLIGPSPGSANCEYGILRSFESDAACQAFYDSVLFRQWQEQVVEFVDGEPIQRPLTGLEAFFRESGSSLPPRWKMGLVTWLGVFPTVLVWSTLLPSVLSGLHYVIVMGIVTACVVVTLTWAVMPILTKLLHRWLHH